LYLTIEICKLSTDLFDIYDLNRFGKEGSRKTNNMTLDLEAFL